jgi:hypothetical protein
LSLAGTRVFVVEDEALVLLSFLDMLGAMGCSAFASGLAAGLARANPDRPHAA